MADEAPSAGTKIPGWLKTVIGTATGLLSGAIVMYLSPLLDRVVKPARPVANFKVDHEGTIVTFFNCSSGGGEGWWDFGDGSPLEPVSAKQETVTHAYAAPGEYLAKLTVRNRIGEESERTVNLQLASPRTERPEILTLEATPISPGAYAPATFRLVSKARNARLCVWDFGDDRPLQIDNETPNNQDQLVTFSKPGGYMVKMAAVNGEQAKEKNTIVFVDEPPTGMLTAILNVTDQGTRVDKLESTLPITISFPPGHPDSVYRFDQPIPAKAGFDIVAVHWEPVADQGAHGVDLHIASDRHSARLTGTLVKEGGLLNRNAQAPRLTVRVLLTQESRVAASRPSVPITVAMSAPGSVLLPLPSLPESWVDPQRHLRLEMRDGDRVLWQDSPLPRRALVSIKERRWNLTATPLGDQVRVQLAESKPDLVPTGN